MAGREISRIRTVYGDLFEPRSIVDESRNPIAPLHDEFEWDDTIAGDLHRVSQARYLLRHIVVRRLDEPSSEPLRAFVSVRIRPQEDEPSVARYTALEHAMNTPSLREQLLRSALRDMEAFARKFAALKELAGVIGEMDKVRRDLRGVLDDDDVDEP